MSLFSFCTTPTSKTFPPAPGCQTFPVATVSSLCCHLQALTGAFSQLPPKAPIVPKRLTFPPQAPIKIHYSFPIIFAVVGALALCLVELVGFSSPFHYYWNFSKDGRSENSNPHMYVPWGQQQHFNEIFNLISLPLVIMDIRKIQVKESICFTWWHGLLPSSFCFLPSANVPQLFYRKGFPAAVGQTCCEPY